MSLSLIGTSGANALALAAETNAILTESSESIESEKTEELTEVGSEPSAEEETPSESITEQTTTEETTTAATESNEIEVAEGEAMEAEATEAEPTEAEPTEANPTKPELTEPEATEPATEEPVEEDSALQAEKASLSFESKALQPAYKNAIFVNGEFFSFIDSDKAVTLDIPVEKLKEAKNRITFICGSSATGTYYDESVAPSTRNHNDPQVGNLLATVDGVRYIPVSLTKYFITDANTPAVESNRPEDGEYQAGNFYKFGDGQPNGSPHQPDMTVPYKIDFVFDFSKEGDPNPADNPNLIIKQVNAHVGANAATSRNISWVTVEKTQTKVLVQDASGVTVYEKTVEGTSNDTVFTYTAEVTGLTANSSYTYTLQNEANTVQGSFKTAVSKNSGETIRFAFLADPQVSNVDTGEATDAVFNQLKNYSSSLDFVYIAGDHTNKSNDEAQWQQFFHNGGAFPNATQEFLLHQTLLSTQGNHDRADFYGHINTPDELGMGEFLEGVYSVDYGKVKFIVLNNASYNTKDLANNANFQKAINFLRDEVADAKANGMWTIVGFHKPLYTGASHISDGDVIAYRKLLNPILTER
jgi:hypothetical protein